MKSTSFGLADPRTSDTQSQGNVRKETYDFFFTYLYSSYFTTSVKVDILVVLIKEISVRVRGFDLLQL
jgi:hypothetical protein